MISLHIRSDFFFNRIKSNRAEPDANAMPCLDMNSLNWRPSHNDAVLISFIIHNVISADENVNDANTNVID